MDVAPYMLFLAILAFWQFILRASCCQPCVVVLFEAVEAFIWLKISVAGVFKHYSC